MLKSLIIMSYGGCWLRTTICSIDSFALIAEVSMTLTSSGILITSPLYTMLVGQAIVNASLAHSSDGLTPADLPQTENAKYKE